MEALISIAVGVVVYGVQIIAPKKITVIAPIGYGAIVVFPLLFRAVDTARQYAAWNGSEFGKLFLPPHQPISYFASYVWTNFWLSFVLTVGVSIGILFVLWAGNTLAKRRFFYSGEIFLGAGGAGIVGYSNALLYIALLLATGVAYSLTQFFFKKNHERFSLYYLWIPVAVAIAIAMFALQK